MGFSFCKKQKQFYFLIAIFMHSYAWLVHIPYIGSGKKCSLFTNMEKSERRKEQSWWIIERNMPTLWCCPSRSWWRKASDRTRVNIDFQHFTRPPWINHSCNVSCFLMFSPAGLSLLKRVLFYATFFHLYGSTCHQPLKKLNRILFHWCHLKVCNSIAFRPSSKYLVLN
jgi:hypothetical protein